ncbi:MAG: DUF2147 domain-containing protein [Acidobacteriota bacterium]
MKRQWILGMALLLLLTPWATESATLAEEMTKGSNPIEGVWVTADGEGWVEIRRHGGSLEGIIVGSPDGIERLDEQNPDPALRQRELTGVKILQGFNSQSATRWIDGTIYDPDNGKTYSCTLELEGENTLKVRGYLGVSLFGRTEKWERRKE